MLSICVARARQRGRGIDIYVPLYVYGERDLETVRVFGSVSVCLMKHPDWPVSVSQPINFQCGRAFISSPEPN